MADLINRQVAIDALDKRFDSVPMEQTTEILMLRRDLRELPSAERTGHWIPVTEKLPEVGSIVLCYCKHRAWMVGRINVCKYCAADKYKDKPYFDYNMNGFPEVIAWMPLPEPYKEV